MKKNILCSFLTMIAVGLSSSINAMEYKSAISKEDLLERIKKLEEDNAALKKSVIELSEAHECLKEFALNNISHTIQSREIYIKARELLRQMQGLPKKVATTNKKCGDAMALIGLLNTQLVDLNEKFESQQTNNNNSHLSKPSDPVMNLILALAELNLEELEHTTNRTPFMADFEKLCSRRHSRASSESLPSLSCLEEPKEPTGTVKVRYLTPVNLEELNK